MSANVPKERRTEHSLPASNHRILWSGAFLDATLTFVLPDEPIQSLELETFPGPHVVILFAIQRGTDVVFHGKLHVREPVEVTFPALLADTLKNIESQYLEDIVMPEKEEALSTGAYLQ